LEKETGPDKQEPVDSLPPIETMPELTKFVEAEYPASVYGEGMEGTVVMELLVSDSGTVDSAVVRQGVHPTLDSNAVAAARQFVFTPAIAGGDSVPVFLTYEYRFSLREVVEEVEEYVNFSGELIERGTRQPIADALVVLQFADTLADTTLEVPFGVYLERLGRFDGQYVEEGRLVTVSDSTGAFSFTSLPAGPIEVTIPVAGYEEFYQTEDIGYGEATEVTYYLRRVSYSDFEFTVYGKKEEKEVSRRTLTLSEVKKIPGIGGDAVKVVQALPGVARPTFGTAGVVVRGAPTSNSKFLLDGIEIPLLFHFGGVKSTYYSDALEQVDFYPGGFGTRYGGVLGGVVELTGRKPKTDRWHAHADANFFDGVVFAEGPVGSKVSVMASVRRSFIGEIIGWVLESYPTGNVLTTAPFYWDYLLRTDVDINDNHDAYLTLFGVKDGFKLVSSEVRGGNSDIDDATDQVRAHTLFHMGILGHDWDISESVVNKLRYSFGYVESYTSAFGFVKTVVDYYQHYFRDQLTWQRGERLKVNVGADVQVAPVDLDLQIPGGDRSIQATTVEDELVGVVGAYLNLEWKPIEQLLIIPGLRYDYFPELTYDGGVVPEYWDYGFENESGWSAEPSLRLTTRYEFVENHTAKLAAGNYSQTPQPIVQSINETWGDPSLSVMRAAHYVLGYEWQITDLINLDIEAYLNRQWDVAQQVSGFPMFSDDARRRMKGIELMLRHDQSERFFGWLAYSFSKSETYDLDERRWRYSDKDQTHNLIAVGNWKLPKNWEVGFRLQYTTGDPVTPIVGSGYDEFDTFFFVDYGPTNSQRMQPTFQLDLRIDKKFVFRKWMLAAYIDFFNISYFLYKSPQMYILNFGYPYNPETGEVYQTTAHQYSLPSIGLRAEF
ncbi:MAG: TonB family protein, partial [Chitinivibrionales bacterium]|nr:TonB family protein [Chitinivibrionales bacterium]